MRYKHLRTSFIKFIDKGPAAGLLLLLAVAILVLAFYPGMATLLRDSGLVKNDKATLVLTLDNQRRTFEGETTEGMTLLDVLNLSTSAGKIKFKYSIEDNGEVQVMAIDGHLIDNFSSKFHVFLNSQPISISDINKVAIKAGDEILVRAIK